MIRPTHEPVAATLNTTQLGLNALADLTHEEYKAKFALGFRKFVRADNRLPTAPFSHGGLSADNLPLTVDWRQNAVAEVKNQQQVWRAEEEERRVGRLGLGSRVLADAAASSQPAAALSFLHPSCTARSAVRAGRSAPRARSRASTRSRRARWSHSANKVRLGCGWRLCVQGQGNTLGVPHAPPPLTAPLCRSRTPPMHRAG
jgi:hypothetical protein